MHDERINCIVANAFDGMGDSTGSDEYGYSVAWIDLCDHVEPYGAEVPDDVDPADADSLGEWLMSYTGSRWALAYTCADGTRDVVGYMRRSDMMTDYRAFESEYSEWENANGGSI